MARVAGSNRRIRDHRAPASRLPTLRRAVGCHRPIGSTRPASRSTPAGSPGTDSLEIGCQAVRRPYAPSCAARPFGALAITAVSGRARAFDWGVGVGPPIQGREVGDAEVTGERVLGQQLADWVPDPLPLLGARQHQWTQTGR